MRSLRVEALSGPVIRADNDLLVYFQASFAHLASEELRRLYLNSAARLIKEDVVRYGLIHEIDIHPRKMVVRALEEGAARIIPVHTHPSGDPTPSGGGIAPRHRGSPLLAKPLVSTRGVTLS